MELAELALVGGVAEVASFAESAGGGGGAFDAAFQVVAAVVAAGGGQEVHGVATNAQHRVGLVAHLAARLGARYTLLVSCPQVVAGFALLA